MTIQATSREAEFIGNGVSTSFPFTFQAFNRAHVSAYLPATGATLALDSAYSVALNSDQVASPGGTVTYPIAGSPLAPGVVLRLVGDLQPELQNAVLSSAGGYFPKTIERALDYIVALIQQLSTKQRRTLHFSDGDATTDGTIGLVETRKGKYLFFNVVTGAVEYALAIIGTTLSQSIIGSFLYPPNGFENSAGVVITNVFKDYYVRSRYASFVDWKTACNAAAAEGVLDADYMLAADTDLPKFCDFRGHTLSGAFFSTHSFYAAGWVKHWKATKPRIRGCYYCTYTGISTPGAVGGGKITVDGGDGVIVAGCFWNDIGLANTDHLELNADHFDVNQNTFRGGVARFVHLTGGTGGAGGIHANRFVNIDVSDYLPPDSLAPNRGFLQDDEKRYVNYIEQGYYENGSDITGNFHISGLQGDAHSPPRIDRFAHLWNVVGINQQVSRDFPSIGIVNSALGGDWSVRDGSGVPPAFSNFGGAAVSVQADSTEPNGCGSRYEASFAGAFGRQIITLQPTGIDRFGVVIFYKSTAEFVAVESNDGSGAIAHNISPVTVDSTNNWKMLRLAGAASKTGTTTINLFAYAGSGGAAKVISLGGVFAAGERAVIPPQKQLRTTRYGSATVNPASLADGARTSPATMTVTGAALRDSVSNKSFSLDLQGVDLHVYVSGANTVTYSFANETGAGPVDLASGTLYVETQPPYA